MKHAIASVLLAASATLLATPVFAHRTSEPVETVTPTFHGQLPNVPGKAFIAVEVLYPPGGASPSHRHEKSAFIYAYVLSGEIISAVDDEAPRVYRAGDSWQEAPGTHHSISRNASKTEPAKLLAIFVADAATGELTFPDPK